MLPRIRSLPWHSIVSRWAWVLACVVIDLHSLAASLPVHRFTNSLTGDPLSYRFFLPPSPDESGRTNRESASLGPPAPRLPIPRTETPSRFPIVFWLPDASEPPEAADAVAASVGDAIAQGVLPPLILVFPDQGAASWFQDSADGRIGDETFFFRDVVRHVDVHLPARPEREQRFLAGHGTGGWAAFRLGLRYPRRFAAASAIDGEFPAPTELVGSTRFAPLLRPIHRGDLDRARTNQPSALVRLPRDPATPPSAFQLVHRSGDARAESHGTRQLVHAFRSARVPLEQADASSPGVPDGPAPKRTAEWAALEFLLSWSSEARALDRDGPWVNPPTNRPPRLTHHLVYSRRLQRPVGYSLWYPVRNDADAVRSPGPLPVIYHLGGRGESESDYLEATGYLAASLRLREVAPAAWVWLYAGRSSWFTDSSDGRVPAESVLLQEVIPQLERRWNLGGHRDRRAFDGWGMGAYGALALASRHPEFCHAILLHNPDLPDAASFPGRHPDAWIGVFGSDPAWYERDSPWQRLLRLGAGPESPPRFRIRLASGARSLHVADARRLRELLRAANWAHEYEEVPDRGTGGPALYPATALRDLRFLSPPGPEGAPGK